MTYNIFAGEWVLLSTFLGRPESHHVTHRIQKSGQKEIGPKSTRGDQMAREQHS